MNFVRCDKERTIAKTATVEIVERKRRDSTWYILNLCGGKFWSKYWTKSAAFQVAYHELQFRSELIGKF